MDLVWKAPLSNGGCPITSYAIWMDDGAGGAFSQVDSALVNNIPELREYVITFPVSDTSLPFRIYLEADNVIGSVNSATVTFVLAAVPSMPTTAPYVNVVGSRSFLVQVIYDPLTAS